MVHNELLFKIVGDYSSTQKYVLFELHEPH
jgi:hypothetical protein